MTESVGSVSADNPMLGAETLTEEELQQSIVALDAVPLKPESAWIAKMNAAPTQVIIGIILRWTSHVSVTAGPDPKVSQRTAAQAILQARFSRQMADATTRLHETIGAYQRESGRQTAGLLRLTWVIAVLTAMMLGAVAVQIVMATRGGQ